MSPKEKDLVTCPRCGRPAWTPGKVQRTGKNPLSTFWYLRYKHPKRYGRNEIHYVRVDDEGKPLTSLSPKEQKAALHTVKEPVKRKVPLTLEEDEEVTELEKAVELVQKRRRLKSLEG